MGRDGANTEESLTLAKPRIKRFVRKDMFGVDDSHWFVWYGQFGSGRGKRFESFAKAARWSREWFEFEKQMQKVEGMK